MSKWLMRCLFLGLILALVFAGCAKGPPAVAPQEFYKGATLNFIVPYAPGGTYDLWARGLQPYLSKYTGATVIVTNMEGAAGLVGGGYLYNSAKADGLTIGILPMPGMVMNEMLGAEGVKYELAKFSWVGRVEVMWRSLFANAKTGIKTIADMQKATSVRFGTVDPSSQSSCEEAMLCEAFGIKGKIVPGYPGSKDYMKAVIAGKEVDAASTSLSGYESEVKAGTLNLVAMLGTQRNPGWPDVPTALETPGLSAQGKKYLELLTVLVDAGRAVAAPPGVPADRLAFLESALTQSLKDPEVVAFAAKSKYEISPMSSAEYTALIKKLLQAVPVAERPAIKEIITKKYF